MGIRNSYVRWQKADIENLRTFGPHRSEHELHKLMEGRHTLESVRAKLRRLRILKTPERRAAAYRESFRYFTHRLRCSRCKSYELEEGPKR